MRLLVAAYARVRPEVAIELPSSIGSSGAVRAAADAAIAVGLVSRPLREREHGLGLTVVPYAHTAVVLAAHPTVADDGVTNDELVQIYRGTRTRWRNGREIVVLTREPGDSSIEVLEGVIPGFKDAYAESQGAKRWLTLYTDQVMAWTLAGTPYGIGLSDSGAIAAERLPLKVLKVNGMLPTPENVRSRAYPLVKTLSFVFRPEKLPPDARSFIDFARSAEGAALLAVSGYVPGR